MRHMNCMKKLLFICLVLALLVSSPAPVPAAGIPTSAKSVTIGFVRHYFKAYNMSMTWQEAKAYCESMGGHLATVASAPEQEILKSLGCKTTKRYWLGASDAKKEGSWKWITGERWAYTQWAENQPSQGGASKDYLQLYVKGGYLWIDAYSNRSTSLKSGFICEWEEELTDIGRAKVTLSGTSYVYTGSARKPAVTVTYGGKTLVKGTDYTVTYVGATGMGTASVFVVGQGKYAGMVRVTYTIKPGKPVIAVKSSNAGQAVISWDAVKGATGYRVEYRKATETSYKKAYTSYCSKKLTGLTPGEKYVFRVRAYAKVSGSNLYGSVSTTVTKTVRAATTLAMPMKGYVLGRRFGEYAPGMEYSGRTYHSGLDMTSVTDKNIYASAAGEVLCVRSSGGNGYHVVIEHSLWGKKVYTLYSHMVAGSIKVSAGETVSAGQVIGTMGATGNVAAPHLHFAVYTMENGVAPSQDPWGYVEEKDGEHVLRYRNIVFYDPEYVISHGVLPEE